MNMKDWDISRFVLVSLESKCKNKYRGLNATEEIVYPQIISMLKDWEIEAYHDENGKICLRKSKKYELSNPQL